MSTDYFFKCEKCNLRSNISFARQAWGWGNCWATNTFSFILKHTCLCGEKYISCIHQDEAYEIEVDNDIPEDFKDLNGFEEIG